MTNHSKVNPFGFKDLDHEQVIEFMNEEYPVNIRYNEDLINRIHTRYPILDKASISVIVKAIFQSMRELLLMGRILNFFNFFPDMKLFVFTHHRGGVTFPAVRVKVSTSKLLKGNNGERI